MVGLMAEKFVWILFQVFVSITQFSDFWVMSYGNWKHILGIFSFYNSVFNDISVIKHTPRDPPATTFDSLSFLFIYFSTLISLFFNSVFLSFFSSFSPFSSQFVLFFFHLSHLRPIKKNKKIKNKKIKKQGWRGKGRELRLRQSYHLRCWISGSRFVCRCGSNVQRLIILSFSSMALLFFAFLLFATVAVDVAIAAVVVVLDHKPEREKKKKKKKKRHRDIFLFFRWCCF